MANTGRSSVSSSVSSPHRLHLHHHSSSSSNFNLSWRLYPENNCNSTTTAVDIASNRVKRTCLCSPTTHPGSFRCAFHRRLEDQKTRTLATARDKLNNDCDHIRVNLRKLAIMNSLKKIGTIKAEWLKRSMENTLISEKKLCLERPRAFQPRRSRLYTL